MVPGQLQKLNTVLLSPGVAHATVCGHYRPLLVQKLWVRPAVWSQRSRIGGRSALRSGRGPFSGVGIPGMALWGKGPAQLFTTCLIAHLTFAGLNQECLVWAGCTRPTGQAGGFPAAQAAQASSLKCLSGEEKQGLSFAQPGWVWAPEGTGGGGWGRWLLGSGHSATEQGGEELGGCDPQSCLHVFRLG